MLNKIWFGLLVIGLLYGFGRAACQATRALLRGDQPSVRTQAGPESATAPGGAAGRPAPGSPATRDASAAQPAAEVERPFTEMGKKLTTDMIDAAGKSVELAIGLIGAMALWLGFMKIAEDAGLIALLSRALQPLLRWLFPEIPPDHPAGGAVIMNLSANLLGLDNAATPLGLKAMRELEAINPHPGTATNAMAMFLAINTSSITLIPFTIIGYRVAAGSRDPAAPIFAMLLATTCSTAVAILAARALQRFYPPPKLPLRVPEDEADGKERAE